MASTDISNFNATVFSDNLRQNVTAKGGKMRSVVEMVTGDLYREAGIYPFIKGSGLPQQITQRAPESPVSNERYSNRKVTRADFHDGILVDRQDLDRMQVDPWAAKTEILMGKFRRLEDLVIQEAALGTALGGDAGATSVSFKAGNIIDVTLGAASGLTNAGFTYEKLLATLTGFGNDSVDIGSEQVTIAITYNQLNDIMKQDKFINKDYINQSVMQNGWGMIQNYMGVNWVITNILPYMDTAGTGFSIDRSTDVSTQAQVDAGTYNTAGIWIDSDTTDIRACIAMVKSAVMFEVKPDIVTKVAELAANSFRPYAYMEMGLGAVRAEEEKVRAIPCDQSPA